MIDIRVEIGEFWEVSGERYCLEQVMGGGFLLLRSVRTGAPYQVVGDGEAVSPTMNWLKAALAAGEVRRIPLGQISVRGGRREECDFEVVRARDPQALLRQMVLSSLDRLPSFARSDDGIRWALNAIWTTKPARFSPYKKPGASTVRNWLRDRGVVGQRPLAQMQTMTGKGTRKKVLSPAIRRRVHHYAMRYWADLSLSMGDVHAALVARLARVNKRLVLGGMQSIPVPSFETMRLHIRRVECWETFASRYGKKAANERFKACGRGLAADRALRLGAMDHTSLDCMVVVQVRRWRVLGRPTLTVLIDVYSRCILGWVLSFEPASLFSVMECVKRANRPKMHLLEERPDYPELADIFGKFDEIVVDNGKEFAGTSFEAGMTDIGTTVRWAPVRSPTHKALVERLFGTLNTRIHRKLPGGVFPPAQLREWGIDPSKCAVLSLEQVEALISRGIGDYHLSFHRELGRAPIAAWIESVRQAGIQVIGDESQLDKMAGAHETRSLSRSGIEIFDLQYHDPAIVGPLLERLASREGVTGRSKGSARATVNVKYNPANIGEIHIWDPTAREFVTLPCVEEEYSSGLSLWLHRRMSEWRAEDRNADAVADAERRVAFRREIEAMLPERKRKANRRAVARLLSSPKLAQLAGDTVRIAMATPRHDGMAPIVPMNALAPDRTDGLEKPVRPASRRKKTSAAGRATPPDAIVPQTGAFPNFDGSGDGWEEFQ